MLMAQYNISALEVQYVYGLFWTLGRKKDFHFGHIFTSSYPEVMRKKEGKKNILALTDHASKQNSPIWLR